jgi:hypothetical protein
LWPKQWVNIRYTSSNMLLLNPEFPGVGIVDFPRSINLCYLERLSAAVRKSSVSRKLVLDFRFTQWAKPFDLLILSSLINEFKSMNPEC